jgi:hypothetical protein
VRSILTGYTFPLSSVKPLDGLLDYRACCLAQTREALGGRTRRRERSPVSGAQLEPFGSVDGLDYLRCPESGSLFLAQLPESTEWARLLVAVSHYRHSPRAFHSGIAQSRDENVYAPKLEWIQSTLRLLGVRYPRVMEVVTAPSDFTRFLENSDLVGEIVTVDQMELVMAPDCEFGAARSPGVDSGTGHGRLEMAVLLESLDRADDPEALLCAVADHLTEGGLLFITALVCSGFDMAVLGLRNLYLFPPDRTNCFSLRGVEALVSSAGFTLLEVSTPGVLDVEIVQAHLRYDPSLPLSPFERQLLAADSEAHAAFQSFLQQRGMSSFARIVAMKQS